MNAAGPLLRDIHVPSAACWPPAPGWWLVVGVAAGLTLLGVVFWMRRSQRGTLRAVLREIDVLEAAYARDADLAFVADAASRLLRRVARRIDAGAASATGEAWRAFVRRHASGRETRAVLEALIDQRYRACPTLDAASLFAALRAWCRAALGSRTPRIARRRAQARKLVSP